jgi:hypothetical protein
MDDQPAVEPMALDPAMTPAHIGNVMCNTAIMPPYAATLDPSAAFPVGLGGRGGVLIRCMGNLSITRAVQADLIATPPALDDGQQGIIETACKAMLLRTLAESPRLEADALADLVSKSGVRVEPWPEDVMDALRSSWEAVAKEEGDRDAFFQAVFDDLARFRAKATTAPQPTAASP